MYENWAKPNRDFLNESTIMNPMRWIVFSISWENRSVVMLQDTNELRTQYIV